MWFVYMLKGGRQTEFEFNKQYFKRLITVFKEMSNANKEIISKAKCPVFYRCKEFLLNVNGYKLKIISKISASFCFVQRNCYLFCKWETL